MVMRLGEVEVTTARPEGRHRQISANIQIPAAMETVWQVLTDYNHLAEFIPNLTQSRQISHPHGGVRLEQVGAHSFLKFKFCARVVLDMVEQFPHRLTFQMVEGDFREFTGSWQLVPVGASEHPLTELRYTIQVLPPRTMPIGLIERCLQHNLAMNLTAIRQRVEAVLP
ncbi:MAG: cyclase [Leptolyngbyaceae cyanobacterium SL_7_1]|nr:cyclase [Leptolyngbyaceae cyanobacterium SL_7_1]